jgi:hypothetical protein
MSNTSHTDLAALLADLGRVPVDQIPAAIGELEKAKAMLWARLAVPVPTNGRREPEADELVDDVAEVARIVRHSVSWVRKNGHRLSGFRQPGGKGTRVAWSRAALQAWARGSID